MAYWLLSEENKNFKKALNVCLGELLSKQYLVKKRGGNKLLAKHEEDSETFAHYITLSFQDMNELSYPHPDKELKEHSYYIVVLPNKSRKYKGDKNQELFDFLKRNWFIYYKDSKIIFYGKKSFGNDFNGFLEEILRNERKDSCSCCCKTC